MVTRSTFLMVKFDPAGMSFNVYGTGDGVVGYNKYKVGGNCNKNEGLLYALREGIDRAIASGLVGGCDLTICLDNTYILSSILSYGSKPGKYDYFIGDIFSQLRESGCSISRFSPINEKLWKEYAQLWY